MASITTCDLRTPLIDGGKTLHRVTEDVCAPLEAGPTGAWYLGFAVSLSALLLGVVAVVQQVWTGVGVWGLNRTVGWAFDITNFVFWVGIGHAGTLISAILFLLRQRWRTSVNRAAEAMTIFAVICAFTFPILHTGRPWLLFWGIPYPNTRGSLWPNFRSPLTWDFFAIGTYFLVSLAFWYLGMVPDLATARDRAVKGTRRSLLSLASHGWNGSHRTRSRYEIVYLLLAGLSTPLVFSVHTIVSFDFATSVIPGWHATLFPPYFVCGAILSGFAMVLTLMLVARRTMRLEHYITPRHLDAMCKVTLLTSLVVGLAYATELLTAWYSANPYEHFVFLNRMLGPYAYGFALMVGCNVLLPQLFWFESFRRRPARILPIVLAINVGMWFERFVIIAVSLHRDYLPANWTSYAPTWVEISMFIGSFGLFFTAFFLFCRFLPVIAMAEVKGVLDYARRKETAHAG